MKCILWTLNGSIKGSFMKAYGATIREHLSYIPDKFLILYNLCIKWIAFIVSVIKKEIKYILEREY